METPITIIPPEVRADMEISCEQIARGEFVVVTGGKKELEELLDRMREEGRTN